MSVNRRQYKLRLIGAIVFIVALYLTFMFMFMATFRPTIIYRTGFTPTEEEHLKRVVGEWLPKDARVDWAMLYHTHDTDYYIRMQVPTEVARKFRQRVEAAGERIDDYDPRWLAANSDALPPKIDAAFAVSGEVDFIIFGRSNDDLTPVYFETIWYPERKNSGIQYIFVSQR
jgi:hypothetical protein